MVSRNVVSTHPPTRVRGEFSIRQQRAIDTIHNDVWRSMDGLVWRMVRTFSFL